MTDIKTDNRGMIIVFTLILLAVFLTTALSFSYFIIGDINNARAIDDSVIAYYAADAGMEESLYLLQKQGVADSINGLKASRPSGGIMAASQGSWDIGDSTNYERSVLRQRLYNGQSEKFFILNRSASPNPVRSITLEWYKGSEVAPKMQVNLTQLSPLDEGGTMIYYLDTSEIEVADSNTNGKIARCYDLKDADLSGAPLAAPPDYMAEFKVLGSNHDFVDQLLVKAYGKKCNDADYADSFNPYGITNLTLKSKGVYGRSQQTIVAHILPKDPITGLLGFVLFSQEDVTKE